jgi:cell division control protein 24
VVWELLKTERIYVQDLVSLYELKEFIVRRGILAGDVIHDIFLNINGILDFQQRFLIVLEATFCLPEAWQEWGRPFVEYEDVFGVYEPFIANQRRATEITKREFEKIAMANPPFVVDCSTLCDVLLKPMSRLVKYHLLLKVRIW